MFGCVVDVLKIFVGLVTIAYVAFEVEGLFLFVVVKGDEDLFVYVLYLCVLDEDVEF